MNSSFDRRTLIKLLGAAAGATVGASALGACGGGSGSAQSKSFKFAAWSLADKASKAGVQNLVDGYEKAGKGVKITGVPIAYPDYVNQITLQIKGGQLSGAVQLDIATLGGIAAMGKLRDLGSLAKGVDYTRTALSTGRLQGKQYGLPWTTGAIGLIVNPDILGKVDADALPATIDEFELLLAEIKKAGFIPYAASTKVAQLKDILIWMETFGCTLIDGDKVTIGDKASIEAVTWYKSLLDRELIAPDVERVDARNLFAQGKTAMYDDAMVGRDVVAKESPDKKLAEKITSYSRPVLKKGDKPRAQQWGHIIVVVDGEGADTAAAFAKWATSNDDAVLGYYKDVSLPPTTERALRSPTVAKDAFTTDFNERVTKTATPNPFWRFPRWAQMETAVAQQVQAVLIGKASPRDAMRQAGKAVQDLV